MNNKAVLFGGSFDPPHLGHLLVAQWVSELLDSSVSFLPNGSPPHKNSLCLSPRIEMLKLAIAGNSRFDLDSRELQAETVNYSVDTLRRYSQDFGLTREKLFFVLGSDSLNSLETWRDPQGVMDLCTLVVYEREPLDTLVLERLKSRGSARIILCHAPLINISSTLVRERVRLGKSIRYLVPENVREYILSSGLYKEGNI